MVTDTVISAATGTLSGFSGVTYPANHILYANLTSITLASGTVNLYKR